MPKNRDKMFIYTALPCEAKPLVEHFKLKKDLAVQPFSVYCNEGLCLAVTGLGKCAMSAAVAYTQAWFAPVETPVMVNIGIAGHQDHALGSLFLIDKIIDLETRKNYYPPLVFTPGCPTGSLMTSSTPQLGYDQPHLCDMEASAFYETAMRFSSAELIQCLKVISDNRSTPAENIRPQQVSALIAAQMPALEAILAELSRLAGLITHSEPGLYAELLQRYHFTASERAQLKNRLARWDTLSGDRPPEFDGAGLLKGKDVLTWLEQQINDRDFYL